ncbi:unnamed protein product [Effrenium voratum]|nr:unnamed protein product [Effrenium voratum]
MLQSLKAEGLIEHSQDSECVVYEGSPSPVRAAASEVQEEYDEFTPCSSVLAVGIDVQSGLPIPKSVEDLSEAQDQEIWNKLKRQLQSLEDNVQEIARKWVPKPQGPVPAPAASPTTLPMGQRFRRVSAPMPAGCVQLQSRHDAASPATQGRLSKAPSFPESQQAMIAEPQPSASQTDMRFQVPSSSASGASASFSTTSLSSAQYSAVPHSAKLTLPEGGPLISGGASSLASGALTPGRVVVRMTPVLTPRAYGVHVRHGAPVNMYGGYPH